jgi:hypothetical protein
MSKQIATLKKEIVGKEKNYGGVKENTILFTRKTGAFDIDKDEVEDLLATIQNEAKKKGKEIRTSIRAVNNQRMFTLKALHGDLNIQDFDDYYKNKVKDVNKFEKFSQVYITVQVYDSKKAFNAYFKK